MAQILYGTLPASPLPGKTRAKGLARIVAAGALICLGCALILIANLSPEDDDTTVEAVQLVEPIRTSSLADWDHVNGLSEPGMTWKDMWDFCGAKDMIMCPAEKTCNMQTRELLDPTLNTFNDYDNWIAVADHYNEWLTFGNSAMSDRFCKTHTQVAGGVPDWGLTTVVFDNVYRVVKCCPKVYDWVSVAGAPITKSWSEIQGICIMKGMEICPASTFCDMNSKTILDNNYNIFENQDNWIAVGGTGYDKWLTFGFPGHEDRVCKTTAEAMGIDSPEWSDTQTDWFRAVKCCTPVWTWTTTPPPEVAPPVPAPVAARSPPATHGGGDPVYNQYVLDAGIDGNTAWHVDDMHSCRDPPCSDGWDFPTDKYLPSRLPFKLEPLEPVPGTIPNPDSVFLQFEN